MSFSVALSIKYGWISGVAKGSFVDSNKFEGSDVDSIISVMVINQSNNIKDARIFQRLPSVDKLNLHNMFGDCFIASFLEGGGPTHLSA
jgi:hypothetical protein